MRGTPFSESIREAPIITNGELILRFDSVSEGFPHFSVSTNHIIELIYTLAKSL